MKEWPKINEVFELVLDASAPENDPIEMVHGDGYRIDGWQHTGKKLDGRCSAHFKLIQFSSRIFYYFNHLQLALQDFGVIPEGQWREALKSAFPKAPMFNVGVADASWRLPHEVGQFPCIRWNGESFFRHTSCVEFDSHDLWLVKVID